MDPAQDGRYLDAFWAAKVAAVTLLCARYGATEIEMLEALMDSRNLNEQARLLVARMEVSPAFVRYIHSAVPF